MTKNRIFTQEQLEEMGARTLDLVNKAADEGDTEKVKRYARRMYGELMNMHDLELDMVTALLSFIGRQYGDEVLQKAFTEAVGSWIKQMSEGYAKEENPSRRLQMLVYGLKGHGQPVKVEEDDEKFTLTMQPCGSGGRLVASGAYGPPKNFLRVKKPQLITYGKTDVPVYCAHCVYHELIPIDHVGMPLFTLFPGEKMGEDPCRMVLYKDPKAIPEELYRRVGKQKPKR